MADKPAAQWPDGDRTFDPISAYGSDRWCGLRLGRSHDWFRRARPELERLGFPPKDAITGYTIKADVDAWISRRRRYADITAAPTDPREDIVHNERLDLL